LAAKIALCLQKRMGKGTYAQFDSQPKLATMQILIVIPSH